MAISGYIYGFPPTHTKFYTDTWTILAVRTRKLILKAMLVGPPVAITHKHNQKGPAQVSEHLFLARVLHPLC